MPANPLLICAPSPQLRARLEELRDAGYVTTAVETAADTVSSLRTAPFDLIIAEGLEVSGAIPGIRSALTASAAVSTLVVTYPDSPSWRSRARSSGLGAQIRIGLAGTRFLVSVERIGRQV